MRKGEQTFAAFSPTLEVSSGTVWGYQVKEERKKKRRKKERKKREEHLPNKCIWSVERR